MINNKLKDISIKANKIITETYKKQTKGGHLISQRNFEANQDTCLWNLLLCSTPLHLYQQKKNTFTSALN